MIVQTQLAGLQSNLQALDKIQDQVSSGSKIQQASDDPSATFGVMTTSSALNAITQYQKNVGSATDRINAEDSTLQQLTSLLTSAQQLAVQQGSANVDAATRQATAAQAAGLLQSAVQLANTKFGDEYLFGGPASTTAPFDVTGSGASIDYTSDASTGQRSIQVGDGQTLAVTHDGSQVFVATGVLDSLKSLAVSLANNDVDGVNAASEAITQAQDGLQAVVGDVGARGDELQMASSNLSAYQGNLTTLQSNLQDVDVESAVTQLMQRQNAYQAAMLATSKVMDLNLANYLQ